MELVDSALDPFTREDAILDPATDEALQQYISAGGDPNLAITALSNSYGGYQDAISELYEWAQLSESGDEVLHNAIKEIVKQNHTTFMPLINSNLAKDPESASTIKTLTASKWWSTFMADLADRNKQTPFYDIVTRQAKLPEIGISSDVLRTPEAFITEIMDQFQNVFATHEIVSKTELVDFLKRIAVMCTYDELTTVVSLRLFAELAQDAKEPRVHTLYQKLSEQIRSEAVKVMTTSSTVPKTIARQYVVRLAINVDCAMSGVHLRKPVIDALVTIADCSHRRRFDKEVGLLMREYGLLLGPLERITSDLPAPKNPARDFSTAQKRALVQALCLPEVLLDLLKALYSHSCRTYVSGQPDPRKRQCLSLLLSYVSVFIHLDSREIEEKFNSEKSKQLLRKSVTEMFDKLNNTAQVCEDLLPGSPRSKIKGKAVEVLLKGVEDTLIARGIVLWAKECLHGGTDLRALLTTAPKHLGFLEAVSRHHDILCEDILVVIHAAFTRDYPGLDVTQVNQLRDLFMKTISGMLTLNMGPQVILTFQRLWVDGGFAKKLHLRNFVTALFGAVSPPYSTSLAIAINEFLEHDRVLSAIEGDVALSGKVFKFRDETAGVLSRQSGITVP